MKKKLIKRLEELAIENELLKIALADDNFEKINELLIDKAKENLFEQINDTGVVLDGIMSKFKDCGKEEERPKTTSSYEELGSSPKEEANKELEEAKEILKDWRFGKCTYSIDEIDRAIETILKHNY